MPILFVFFVLDIYIHSDTLSYRLRYHSFPPAAPVLGIVGEIPMS